MLVTFERDDLGGNMKFLKCFVSSAGWCLHRVIQEIQPVHSKGDQPWDFFGRNDAKAETPVLWPPYAKS